MSRKDYAGRGIYMGLCEAVGGEFLDTGSGEGVFRGEAPIGDAGCGGNPGRILHVCALFAWNWGMIWANQEF